MLICKCALCHVNNMNGYLGQTTDVETFNPSGPAAMGVVLPTTSSGISGYVPCIVPKSKLVAVSGGVIVRGEIDGDDSRAMEGDTAVENRAQAAYQGLFSCGEDELGLTPEAEIADDGGAVQTAQLVCQRLRLNGSHAVIGPVEFARETVVSLDNFFFPVLFEYFYSKMWPIYPLTDILLDRLLRGI